MSYTPKQQGSVPGNSNVNQQTTQQAKTLAGITQQMQNLVHGQNALNQGNSNPGLNAVNFANLNMTLQQQQQHQRFESIIKQQQLLFSANPQIQQHLQQQMQQNVVNEPLALTRGPTELLNKSLHHQQQQQQQQANGNTGTNSLTSNLSNQQIQQLHAFAQNPANIMQQLQAYQYQMQQQHNQQKMLPTQTLSNTALQAQNVAHIQQIQQNFQQQQQKLLATHAKALPSGNQLKTTSGPSQQTPSPPVQSNNNVPNKTVGKVNITPCPPKPVNSVQNTVKQPPGMTVTKSQTVTQNPPKLLPVSQNSPKSAICTPKAQTTPMPLTKPTINTPLTTAKSPITSQLPPKSPNLPHTSPKTVNQNNTKALVATSDNNAKTSQSSPVILKPSGTPTKVSSPSVPSSITPEIASDPKSAGESKPAIEPPKLVTETKPVIESKIATDGKTVTEAKGATEMKISETKALPDPQNVATEVKNLVDNKSLMEGKSEKITADSKVVNETKDLLEQPKPEVSKVEEKSDTKETIKSNEKVDIKTKAEITTSELPTKEEGPSSIEAISTTSPVKITSPSAKSPLKTTPRSKTVQRKVVSKTESTNTTPTVTKTDRKRPIIMKKTPTAQKVPRVSNSGETTPKIIDDERRSKRHRLKTILYQSPLPELAIIAKLSASETSSSPRSHDDKLTLFYKNEYLAVRNADAGFFLCQTLQNVYKTSPKIRIRWMSEDKKNENIYIPDFYDVTDLECVLTTVEMEKMGKDKFKLPKIERVRIENILKKAIDFEKGVAPRPDVTEENPDGLDISLYKDESQIEKKSRKRPRLNSSSKSPKRSLSKTKTPKRKRRTRRMTDVTSDSNDDETEGDEDTDTEYKPSRKKGVVTQPKMRAQRSPLARARAASPIMITNDNISKTKKTVPPKNSISDGNSEPTPSSSSSSGTSRMDRAKRRGIETSDTILETVSSKKDAIISSPKKIPTKTISKTKSKSDEDPPLAAQEEKIINTKSKISNTSPISSTTTTTATMKKSKLAVVSSSTSPTTLLNSTTTISSTTTEKVIPTSSTSSGSRATRNRK